MPPCTRGWSVFTRPPRISGAWVNSPTETTGTPASASAFCVPPVERISTSSAARRRANGTRPLLSDTETRARRTMATTSEKAALLALSARRFKAHGGDRAQRRLRLAVAQRVVRAAGGLVLGDGAQLEESARLDLPDPLAGEVHDRPDLLEREPHPRADPAGR